MTDHRGKNESLRQVFIVDDEQSARESLARLLRTYDFHVTTFASAIDFLNAGPEFNGPACLVLDLQMPEMSGLELQQALAESADRLPIVFLTAHGDIPTTVRAMKQGAEDFLPKLAEPDELVGAIERALARSHDVNEANLRIANVLNMASRLTHRELAVCRHVIAGRLNKQIAIELDIAERTVKAHRAKVMEKLEVDSVAELVRVCQQAGIDPAADE